MIYGIVPAAGSGTRMRLTDRDRAKQYLPLGEGTVLTTTLQALWSAGCFAGLVVVVPEEDVAALSKELQVLPFFHSITVTAGGAERQDSVRLGLRAVPPAAEYVVVHDGVRPLVSRELVLRVVEAAKMHGAATAAVPVHDTVKRVDDSRRITETVNRECLWAVQTPQAFRAKLLQNAHERALKEGARFTDDTGVVEAAGAAVYIVEGDPRNIKLTRPEDLELARSWIDPAKERREQVRVGVGYDVHRLVEGRPLILGGVTIPHEKGLIGHSDADVLSHAITDALLGAAALGDIGQHFPDTDPKYKDADSMELLRQVVGLLAAKGWRPAQVDAVIAAQRPRLAPYLPQIRRSLADVLGLAVEDVSVKATTTEGLGFVGREEGVEVRSVVTIRGCPSD